MNKAEKAIFKIRVTNSGGENLSSIILTDSLALNCAGSVVLPTSIPNTWSNFTTGGTGNKTDAILEPGEYFEYTCEKSNTQNDYTNTAKVDARGAISNALVSDSDTSAVDIENGGGSGSTYRCDDIIDNGGAVTCV